LSASSSRGESLQFGSGCPRPELRDDYGFQKLARENTAPLSPMERSRAKETIGYRSYIVVSPQILLYRLADLGDEFAWACMAGFVSKDFSTPHF